MKKSQKGDGRSVFRSRGGAKAKLLCSDPKSYILEMLMTFVLSLLLSAKQKQLEGFDSGLVLHKLCYSTAQCLFLPSQPSLGLGFRCPCLNRAGGHCAAGSRALGARHPHRR